MPAEPPTARRLHLRGRVQGVGMRPFLAQLAAASGVAARIRNDPQGVAVVVEGQVAALARFQEGLSRPPPLARIAAIAVEECAASGLAGIVIDASARGGRQDLAMPPDGATCADCLRELGDPGDRRHLHPFITCVNCGPRYSIILDIPYDRPRTTMADFPLCPACSAEYADAGHRRHHAQPIACPGCGPRLWLADASGTQQAADHPLAAAAQLLRDLAIVAVKGLGGFHLACRADDDRPIARLRRGKHRQAKPFAIMVRDLAAADRLAFLDDAARAALGSSAAPIVLAPARPGSGISPAVAPGTDLIGLLLPSTPVHHLLAQLVPFPLVMTSGNPGGEPLCSDNAEARSRLADAADAFLMHDRPIARPIDDSVVLATGNGEVIPVRRARGFVPDPLTLPLRLPQCVLAVGGDLKAALCFAEGDQAILSEHLGDLGHPHAYRHYAEAQSRLRRLLGMTPQVVACDLHPGYHSVRFARSLGLPLIRVQHHHAHVAACAAENGVAGPLIGVACDGTGFGSDGGIWGGEVLHVDGASCERCAWLEPFALLGGDAAVRDTWRPAAAWLFSVLGPAWTGHPAFAGLDQEQMALMQRRLARGAPRNCTSLGRLFDAMAFLLGLAPANHHEAQAALALEQAAHGGTCCLPLPPASSTTGALPTSPLLAALIEHQRQGATVADLALAFHHGIAELIALSAIASARSRHLRQVALTGGCFLNRILLAEMQARLAAAGLIPLIHRAVPPGDGGLALGQVLVAAHRSPA